MEIKINCETKHYLSFKKIKIIQDADDPLKELSKEAYQGLKKSILEFGIISPIHVWVDGSEYKSLDGTQRLKTYEAMQNEGYIFPDVPCVFINATTELEARKMLLALVSQYGKLTDQGLYEYVVKNEIDLKWLEETTRLPEIDLDKFINNHFDLENLNNNDPDEVPEVKETNIKLGDMFQLGNHRLLCGDSTKKEDVERLMNGEKADMVFTDPPYGLGIDGQKENKNNANPKHNRKYHEFKGWDKQRPSKEIFDYMLSLNIPICIFGGNYFSDLIPASRGWIYWDKGQNGLTMSDGELAYTNINKPLRAIQANRSSIGNSVHPTQKPIKVVEFCLDYLLNNKNSIVLDLFLGSGSTLIACEKTGRRCYGIEIDPQYVNVIVDRYCKYTGNYKIIKNGEEIEWKL